MNTLKQIASVCWLAGAALTTSVTMTPAYAGEKYPTAQPSTGKSAGKGDWQHLDTNKDGRISRVEAQRDPALKERFDILDANRDGVLDATELGAMASPPASPDMPPAAPGMGK